MTDQTNEQKNDKIDQGEAMAKLIDYFHEEMQKIIGPCDVVAVAHPNHDEGKCKGYIMAGTLASDDVGPYLYSSLQFLAAAEQGLAKIQPVNVLFEEVEQDALKELREMDARLKH